MHIFKSKISRALLECWVCHTPPMSRTCAPPRSMQLCRAGHLFCDLCVRRHTGSCGASSFNHCRVLEDIVPRIEVKCACGGYFRNFKMKEHKRECYLANRSNNSARRKCRVPTELLCCSTCCVLVRPPVLRSPSGDLICSHCDRPGPDNKNYASCPELDYLLRDMIVKIPYPFCRLTGDRQKMASRSSRKLCGKTKGKAPSKDGKMDKNIVDDDPVGSDDDSSDDVDSSDDIHIEIGMSVAEASLKTSACNKKANITTASGKKTDEYESTRPSVGNSTNIGKSKGKAPPKVRKMDNHMVDSDVVESDDDSSDDIHPETGKRVAETVLKTSAYNKKAKIATPSGGQKTGDKMGTPVVTLHPANN